jgi:NADH-quinone oxidoreductase subunit H
MLTDVVQSLLDGWSALPEEYRLVIYSVTAFIALTVAAMAAVVFMVLMERKVLAWLTQRKGPNRVGPFGLLQTIADGVKLLFKEDIMTKGQDKLLFTLAPPIFLFPVFVLYALIPFTDSMQAVALPIGALFVFALSSISVIGVVLAGIASNNKYSLLGGIRSAAQAISYEIPLVLAVLAVVLFCGTMNLRQIVEMQQGGLLSWFFVSLTPLSFGIFIISAIAEVNRVPFDLPEAESELVSGYNTEYSGMKFAMFFLAEYAALFVMCTLTTVFFFGGYYSPLGGLLTQTLGVDKAISTSLGIQGVDILVRQMEMIFWFLSKTYLLIFVAMWLRGTLPRLKPDELMGFSWKFLIPLSLINIFMVAAQRMFVSTNDMAYLILWAVVLIFGFGGYTVFSSNLFTKQLEARFLKKPL